MSLLSSVMFFPWNSLGASSFNTINWIIFSQCCNPDAVFVFRLPLSGDFALGQQRNQDFGKAESFKKMTVAVWVESIPRELMPVNASGAFSNNKAGFDTASWRSITRVWSRCARKAICTFLLRCSKFKRSWCSWDGFAKRKADAGAGLFHKLITDIYRNGAETAESC